MPLALGEAEPVPRVVLHDGFDAIELLFGWRDELDALLAQTLVVAVDVVCLEHADTEGASLDQRLHLFGRLGAERWAGGYPHQDDLEVGLSLGTQSQPAKVVGHGHVGTHFEAELVAVELEGLFLISDVDRRVALALDHG